MDPIHPITAPDRSVPVVELRPLTPLERDQERQRRERKRREKAARDAAAKRPGAPESGVDVRV